MPLTLRPTGLVSPVYGHLQDWTIFEEGKLSNSRFVTVFNLPLAVVAGWLLWRSLDWPLVGDATIFHFIASQFQMGAIATFSTSTCR